MDRMDSVAGFSTLQVTLDGEPLALPTWLADSLASIKTYLECIAMKRQRVLWALHVDGIKVDLAEPDLLMEAYRSIRANTISFHELGERLLSAGRTKIQELVSSVENAALTVLINDDEVAQRFWHDYEPQLREPLFCLRAFQELKQKEASLDPTLLPAQTDQLSFICAEVEWLFRSDASGEGAASGGVLDFSEILDCTLAPWLKSLDQLFQRLQDDLRQAE